MVGSIKKLWLYNKQNNLLSSAVVQSLCNKNFLKKEINLTNILLQVLKIKQEKSNKSFYEKVLTWQQMWFL